MVENQIIDMHDISYAYVKLYRELRNYIWPYETVEHIAELEIAVHNRFPNLQDVRTYFNLLCQDINRSDIEDEDLDRAIEQFRSYIESDDSTVYAILPKTEEVYPNENKEIQ
jgi:hypothetical protein